MPASFTADASGSWSEHFDTTGAPSGTFTVTASAGGLTLVVQYQVQGLAPTQTPSATQAPPTPTPAATQTPAASASCSPASVAAGMQTTCSFRGFPPGSALTATTQYDSQKVFPVPGTNSADASGSWTLNFDTTGSPSGTFTVTASGSGLTLVAHYQVQ